MVKIADDASAVALLETVEAPFMNDDGEDASNVMQFNTTEQPPKPERKRIRRKVPDGLGEAIVTVPAHLRLVSIGRGIANVTCTIAFSLDYPVDMVEVLGEHAYAAVFRGDYLGNGLFLKEAGLTVDVENHVNQRVKGTIPRFDQGQAIDQIVTYILPLLPEELDISTLLAMSLPWRLNVQVDFPGQLALHRMQESFDLTSKAE